MRGLDNWITSGRYSRELIRVHCDECDEWTPVTAETEYGATEWDRDTCSNCGAVFADDAATELDEPPDPADRSDD